jgi:hypothetical protein
MKKVKLYLYPNAQPHDHDSSGFCENSVPFSKKGIEDHCVLVGPEDADYFYMGQLNNDRGDLISKTPKDFKYLIGNENKHICDIEGEGGFEVSNRHPIPKWLWNSVITTMGPLKSYSHIKYLFTRPTFSHLLLDIINNKSEEFDFPENNSFGLRAFLNHKIRALLVYVLHKSPEYNKELHVNKKWEGLSNVGSNIQQEFISTMLNNSISLCPRGSGIDSVRLIESCYYNRVPVLITDYDYYMFGEDRYDTSFCYRICEKNMDPEYLKNELDKIYNTPNEILKEKADQAKEYFETIVRNYFDDPTLYLLRWLEEHER